MSAPPPVNAAANFVLKEVKYSLPDMLNELKAERATGAFASEKLDQTEIGKLFKPKTTRRVKSK
jgi:hypothetical protein